MRPYWERFFTSFAMESFVCACGMVRECVVGGPKNNVTRIDLPRVLYLVVLEQDEVVVQDSHLKASEYGLRLVT